MTVRCVVCRTRRASFVSLLAHEKASGHRSPCHCGGYHFPHRPGGGCCASAPYPNLSRARREKVDADTLIEAFLEDALFGRNHKPCTFQEPPF
jgi:hypothetical protein